MRVKAVGEIGGETDFKSEGTLVTLAGGFMANVYVRPELLALPVKANLQQIKTACGCFLKTC